MHSKAALNASNLESLARSAREARKVSLMAEINNEINIRNMVLSQGEVIL